MYLTGILFPPGCKLFYFLVPNCAGLQILVCDNVPIGKKFDLLLHYNILGHYFYIKVTLHLVKWFCVVYCVSSIAV